jgi:hypothetical protein
MMKKEHTVAVIMWALTFMPVLLCGSGCMDQDPFNLSQRKIAGEYRLEKWEDGKTFYLHKRGHDDSSQGGSIIGGIVRHLGWNDSYIVAERHSICSADADGWMIIDIKSGGMSGPFSEAEFASRPESQGIKTYRASEAWKRLK